MKLYNSFEQLIKDVPSLSVVLSNYEDYLAHTSKRENQEPEKLCDHIRKVNDYALKLIKVHSLELVVDKLINDIIKNQPKFQNTKCLGNYIKSLFIQSIIFHDYGKINPNFQSVKMSNTQFSYDKSIKIESQHSKLSAYLFINTHLKTIHESSEFNETEKYFLWSLTFLFSNPILKHHSSYIEHDIRFEEKILNSLKRFLVDMKIDFNTDSFFHGITDLLSDFREYYKYENYFPVYVLLKLNFSLLTAADYYATNSYSNEFEVDDFGLMDTNFKNKIQKNFWESEKFANGKLNYNNILFKNYEFFENLSIDDLLERSNKNLNQLRQKLTVDALDSVRNNKQNNLFYLEAPTGAGKTNLSLAISIELLKSNSELNKIFYIFPFNTLIAQTFTSIKENFGLNNSEIIQLHSKAGFNEKNQSEENDALYGCDQLNFIDNLFINYPITLFSHVKFFDILKGNRKESNYILHRLCNSIIIIDELQSYNPKHWDKIIFYLSNYSKYFNFKVLLMSATLPKLDTLDKKLKGNIVKLVINKEKYFLNENFKGRVVFNFNLLQWKRPVSKDERSKYLIRLKNFLCVKSERYSKQQEGKIYVIVEFIKKKSASEFVRLLNDDDRFSNYDIFLISGEILEPRRKQVIDDIKSKKYKKVLLITTQVVEAGLDIDMDLGFKDKSLIDSDEQLAGRVNRNANKSNCVVYIFNYDLEANIYGKDERYKITREQIDQDSYQQILETKNFDKLYDLVNEKINNRNENPYRIDALSEYLNHFKNFNFTKADMNFQLIEEANTSVFVPLSIPQNHFSYEDLRTLEYFDINPSSNGNINGEVVWQKYESVILFRADRDYIRNQVEFKKISSLLSKFMFSVYKSLKCELYKTAYIDREISDKYGIIYLRYWNENNLYSYEQGFNLNVINCDNFI